jgi:hypothetical protein
MNPFEEGRNPVMVPIDERPTATTGDDGDGEPPAGVRVSPFSMSRMPAFNDSEQSIDDDGPADDAEDVPSMVGSDDVIDVTDPVDDIDDVERSVDPVATDVDGDGDTNKADAAGETVAHAGGLDPMAVAALALSWMPLVGVVLGFVSFMRYSRGRYDRGRWLAVLAIVVSLALLALAAAVYVYETRTMGSPAPTVSTGVYVDRTPSPSAVSTA